MLARFLYVIGGFIEILIGLRFVFELLGANYANGFVHLVYTWSTPFVAPFAGILGQNATITGNGAVTTSVFDWTALVALVIYGLFVGVLSAVASPRHYPVAR